MVNNVTEEFPSSTVADNVSPQLVSLNVPVPRLIVYRFVNVTSVSDNPPSFSWLSFEGVSNYIVQLSGSKGIVWREKVQATEEQAVTYSSETFLEPGNNYIFTVEIDRQHSCVKSQVKKEVNIAEEVQKGIEKLEKTALPSQFKSSLMAQLDGLLIAREEILNIIQGVTRQGSNSEIICFLNNFLAQGSAFKLLANASSCDDILDALGDCATQLAAANRTFGEYLQLSGFQRAMAHNLVSKGADFAFFAQNLEVAFKLTQFTTIIASNRCDSLCYEQLSKAQRCSQTFAEYCGGCADCRESNPIP